MATDYARHTAWKVAEKEVDYGKALMVAKHGQIFLLKKDYQKEYGALLVWQ